LIRELTELLVVIVLLLMAAGASLVFLIKEHDRQKKFASRLTEAVDPAARPAIVVEERVSLTRNRTQMEELEDRVLAFIGVDLQQRETYPVPWFLVPPVTLIMSVVLVYLGTHPLHSFPTIVYLLYVLTPLIWLYLTRFVFNMFTNKRNDKLLQQFPDALNTIVRCVRIGIPVGEALRSVAADALEPTKTEFTLLADKVSIGISIDLALAELAERIKLTEYRFFATALSLQSRSGGNITQTLETLADVIRKRVGLKARGYALTAEARMSSYLLLALPFVAAGAIFLMEREYIIILFTTPTGQTVLGIAALLMVLGYGSIQYLLSSVLK
jgi:tight adherence protein B